LAKATTTTLLADFIQDRAASQDYRRHLGVLALIRNDFEKLSNLMEEENRRLYTDQKIKTLEDEQEGEAEPINRIVLYIDDLDRCPPNVVTDVLQAVHLLLAFPLFVVVVAVDARWIKRSLRARYEELLHTGGHDPTQDNGEEKDRSEEIFGKATPDDYLEKIFQIPFWLNPVDQNASRRMVKGLLQDSLSDARQTEAPDDTEREQEIRAVAPGRAGETRDASQAEVPGSPSTTRPNEERVGTRTTDTQPNATSEHRGLPETPDAERARPGTYVDPRRLKIAPSEMKFITELAPLLGRSPRALKRFVNVYRLVKAGLSEREERRFLNDSSSLCDYQAVLFLLAVDTGLPHIAQDFFDELQSTPERKGLRALIDEHLGKVDSQGAEEWSRLKKWLTQVDANDEAARQVRLPEDAKSLAEWKNRVLRYSFRTEQA
jgi:hypothetical protein